MLRTRVRIPLGTTNFNSFSEAVSNLGKRKNERSEARKLKIRNEAKQSEAKRREEERMCRRNGIDNKSLTWRVTSLEWIYSMASFGRAWHSARNKASKRSEAKPRLKREWTRERIPSDLEMVRILLKLPWHLQPNYLLYISYELKLPNIIRSTMAGGKI